MLIVTRFEGSDLTRTLKLEGKLFGPWISELETLCHSSPISPDRVRLDLFGLTFVDGEGVRLLSSLIHDGARVVACSVFVAELLHLEGP